MDELVEHALDAANQSKAHAFLDSQSVFWVDWNDDTQAVVDAFRIACGMAVTLTDAPADHIGTLRALSRATADRFQVRLALVSVGRDALAFVVLPLQQWQQLDDDIGDALGQVVWALDDDWDPFEALDDLAVLKPYFDLLDENPGRYGECLARALSDPDSVPSGRSSDESDEVMPW